jgi:hypothetical protein
MTQSIALPARLMAIVLLWTIAFAKMVNVKKATKLQMPS